MEYFLGIITEANLIFKGQQFWRSSIHSLEHFKEFDFESKKFSLSLGVNGHVINMWKFQKEVPQMWSNWQMAFENKVYLLCFIPAW